MHSSNELVRRIAVKRWKKLYDIQKNPEEKFFDTSQTRYKSIQWECPDGPMYGKLIQGKLMEKPRD